MDFVRPVSRVSQQIDVYSISNKQTEDFKKALAENVGRPSSTSAATEDPLFALIIRLLRESSHPSARDLLNFYYVSCETTPEATEYFYQQAKTGDTVARIQLGKLFREGKLANSSTELQVVAEAFASQHELAMLKFEQATTSSAESSVPTHGALNDLFSSNIQVNNLDIEQPSSSDEDDSPHRPQHSPMRRIEASELDPQPIDTLPSSTKKPSKTDSKSATKSKIKRSNIGAKAKKVKEPTDG